MAYDIGPKIGIDGEAQFRAEIKQISTALKTLGSEMKVVTSEFIGQENSEKSLTAQNEVLSRTVTTLTTKLDAQKKMLEESTAAYGDADERTQKWQQAVNATQAELNKANAKIAENNEALKDNGKQVEETADKNEGAFSRIGQAAAGMAKVVGTALVAAGAAVGALAKQALEGYGDYEQLVGGVETLFGPAQDKVLAHANDAYKTAGLSANEYMDTVTSFSAALINSLSGDTEKAAEVADVAISDMSDNANKMGSSMESIQNAYQGFAKQNYTMLDNLKLGYGGTKTEMERLLKDAEKLTGKKYDLSNYSDVVEAIHAIQTEMGITGTTAKEASATIQGSISAASSAISNLITGLGDDNANLDQLVNNAVDSVVTVLDNVIPRLEVILTGAGQAVEKIAPIIADRLPGIVQSVLPSLMDAAASLISGLARGLLSALPQLTGPAVEIVSTLTKDILEMLPQLMDAAVEIITTLVNDISEQLPTLIPAAVDMVMTLVTGLLDNVSALIDPAITLIVTLAEGLLNALPNLLEQAPVIVSKLVTALVDNAPKLLVAAVELIGSLVSGIIGNLPQIVGAAGDIVGAVVSGVLDLASAIVDVGAQIVSGIWTGIKEKASWLKDKVTGFMDDVVGGVKDFLGIHSPSRVFAGIGRYMAEGLGEGWSSEMGAIKRDLQNSLDFDAGTVSARMTVPGMTASRAPLDPAELLSGVVNGMQTAMTGAGNDLPQSATIVLQAPDGTTVARWLLPDLRAAMRDDPEPATA